jgi:hypothetical protein
MPASKPREAYRRKRDFSKTIEPAGRTERETAKPETPRFVVARSPKDLISFPATNPSRFMSKIIRPVISKEWFRKINMAPDR